METINFEEGKKKHNKKQNIISLIIIVGGTILAFLLFGPKEKEIQEEVKIIPAEVEIAVIGGEDSTTAKLEKTAVLKSPNSSEAVAENTGRIRQVNFEVGKFVSRGNILAVFDQSESENSARVSLESAQKNLKLAEKVLEKTKESLKAELNRGDEAAKIQVNAARIQREQARLQVEQAEIAHGKTFIKAPTSGMITFKSVSVGDYISAGQVVAQISGGGSLEATLSLNSSQVKRVNIGDEVDIVVSGEVIKGKVSYLSQIASEGNERFEVKIKSEELLKQNTNKSAQIILTLHLDEGKSNSFFVPLEAVAIGQRKTEVFIIEGGKAAIREVKIGEVIGSEVEITDGLSIGDNVIIKNGRNLQDGQEIKITQNSHE